LVKGRLTGAIKALGLRTTLGHRRLFQPRLAAFAHYAAKSFQRPPPAKNVYFQTYCSMVTGSWELGQGQSKDMNGRCATPSRALARSNSPIGRWRIVRAFG
jgi:hypothetical protein